MADFFAYKYEFMPDNKTEGNLFSQDSQKPVDEDYIRKLWGESIEQGKTLPLSRKKRGEVRSVNAVVLACKQDISCLAVHNVKDLKQWEELANEPIRLVSHPHCKVIVDNRKGVQQILVEKSEAFNYNAQTAMKMLASYMGNLLSEYRYKVKVWGKYVARDTWKVVEEQYRSGHPVICVSFTIGSRGQTDIDSNDMYKAAYWYNSNMGGAYTFIKTQAKSRGELAFREANEDCRQLVHILANNGYNLTIKFRGGGVHKSNEQTIALFEMPPGADNDFRFGQLETGIPRLVEWLNDIRKPLKNTYKDVEIGIEEG